MNRRTAIKKRCLNCSAGSRAGIQGCKNIDCSLFPYRTGAGKQVAKARDRAIKDYCRWCSITRHEVVHCPVCECPLHRFRLVKVVDHHTSPELFTRGAYTSTFRTSNEPAHTIPYPDEAPCHD